MLFSSDLRRETHQSHLSHLARQEFAIIVLDYGKDIGVKGWLPYDQVSYINDSDWVMVEADARG